MLLLNLDYLKQCAGSCLFVYLRRDPIYIAQSLLMCREEHYGCRDLWWSVVPKEYHALKEMDVLHQVAGQAFYIKRSIENELAEIPKANQLVVDYESFCADPNKVFGQIADKYEGLGCHLHRTQLAGYAVECANRVRVSEGDFRQLQSAYKDFANGRIAVT